MFCFFFCLYFSPFQNISGRLSLRTFLIHILLWLRRVSLIHAFFIRLPTHLSYLRNTNHYHFYFLKKSNSLSFCSILKHLFFTIKKWKVIKAGNRKFSFFSCLSFSVWVLNMKIKIKKWKYEFFSEDAYYKCFEL